MANMLVRCRRSGLRCTIEMTEDLPLVLAMLIGIPLVVAFVFGRIEARKQTPLVFWCRRCNQEFHQPAHRDFPAVCSRCHARDWNDP